MNTEKLGFSKQPFDYDKFIFDYKRSEFIECNKTLYEANLNKIGSSFKQKNKKNLKIISSVLTLTSYFDDKMINYWISDGSVLGILLV